MYAFSHFPLAEPRSSHTQTRDCRHRPLLNPWQNYRRHRPMLSPRSAFSSGYRSRISSTSSTFCTSNTSTPAPSLPAPSVRDAAMHEPVVWEPERGNGCNHRSIALTIMLPLPVTAVASTSRSIFRALSDASSLDTDIDASRQTSPNSTVEYRCRWGAKKVSQTVKKCCTLPRYQRIH